MAAFDKISFTKLANGNFGVKVPKGIKAAEGQTVEVNQKNGETREVVLGALVGENTWGDQLFEKAEASSR